MTDKLSTDPYKGVRDFYPEDMAIQQYIFETWSQTAESFGYARYDASILEPADMYRAKGAENEEMVNEQTYTFTDRGEREVTLRPEMTPTVARMVAAKKRELAFPLRWYSIPNLFRYERPQKGRLREHWQLNCDMFGPDSVSADVEMISLAYQTLIDFGATPDMFSISINDRSYMNENLSKTGLDDSAISALIKLNDRKNKISDEDYSESLREIIPDDDARDKTLFFLQSEENENSIINSLQDLGIANVSFDKYLARGFDYYTGTIFEIFDTSDENNRSLIGGGRYDNLTGMFSDDPVSGMGFGMGDVTMRDFLETHNLVAGKVKSNATKVVIIPMTADQNTAGQKIASDIRQAGISVTTDISDRKTDKKITAAQKRGNEFVIVVGEDEIASGEFTLKNLTSGEAHSGTIDKISNLLTSK